jgi:hypothetical protein
MLKWSDTSENVLRQLQIVQIWHTYVISSEKIKKIELFGPTFLRNFLLKKSDFLGIFKNVLTGFYCIKCIIITIRFYICISVYYKMAAILL